MRKNAVVWILALLLPLTAAFGQFTDTTTYDFRDGGTILTNQQSADGSLKLVNLGSSYYHGESYGIAFKAESQIKIAVNGSCVIRFVGSQYSSLSMSGTTYNGTPLDPEQVSTSVTNDLSDTYEFEYLGVADTLLFTTTGSGNDVYLPLIDVFYYETPVSYDFRDGGTILTNKQSADGTLKLANLGSSYYHGESYGIAFKAESQIKIAVNGSCIIRFLGSQYSSLSMTATTYDGTALSPETVSTTVAKDLSDTYEFEYYGFKDTLIFTTGNGSDLYLPLITVIPVEQPVAYDFRDGGTILTDKQCADGSLKLANLGSSYYHGESYGIAFKAESQIKISVNGSSIIRFLGSQYSSLTMTATTYDGTPLNPPFLSTQVTNDLSDYYEFTYDGTADTLIFTTSGSGTDTYLPLIEVVPAKIDATPWEQKTGEIIFNNDTITLTAGESIAESFIVEVDKGTVISATAEFASLRMDLDGNSLDSFTPELTGNIHSISVSNDTMVVAFADSAATPFSYMLKIADNSQVIEAEPGMTYSYNFADGSVIPQVGYSELRYPTFITEDGIVTVNSNTDNFDKQFAFHDAKHGAYMFNGNSFDMIVAANAVITFKTCYYSADAAVFYVTDAEGTPLDTITASNKANGTEAEGASSFVYSGDPGTVTFTLAASGACYLHALSIENAKEIVKSGKIDAWDFGATQLDTAIYMNWLTADSINAWYDASIEVGSGGNVLPSSISSGMLSWSGGGNDRLRTSNKSLTRYDENVSSTSYKGRIYVNGSAATGRYISLLLGEDDEVTVVALSQNGSGRLNFQNVANPAMQTDLANLGTSATTYKFVAKDAGTFRLFDDQDKPSYFRVYRKDAFYSFVNGSVDLTAAEGIPSDYTILFENEAGKVWTANITEAGYNVVLPADFTYQMSLANANGYVISSENELAIADSTEEITHDVSIEAVELYEVTGNITGLGDDVANAAITYTADPSANKVYIPEISIDAEAATYSVQLEPNCEYTLSAKGVNDYFIPSNTITITEATATDIIFEAKPLYNVTITANGLTEAQSDSLVLTFTNLNEEGYSYMFDTLANVKLRDGVYQISYDGVDDFPVEMGLTSNITVSGATASKTLEFSPVTNWSFDDKDITGDAYKGLLFSGNIGSQAYKGHLTGKSTATIKIPVVVGDIIRVTYYYECDFLIDSTARYATTSKSTGLLENADYAYPGSEDGFITLTIGDSVSTSYITNIEIGGVVDYTPTITVGTDKDYQTINGALDAISKMIRENGERVEVVIDPGNYEEMLVIDQANITFTNASSDPSIGLLNEGVDIADNAVRITSYYGHGYNYYSMGDDQKWNKDVLRVNKENGYLSYENVGSGTTNGSYWNATVVIYASGFEANHIIFENSFNQYISQKEADDVVAEWESGSKGTRPAIYGNTSVQDKDFVERAAAISLVGADKVILNKCRVVGRQDSFFGNEGSRVVIYKGDMMGATDYIFGGMTAVFYKADLMMNTSDASTDVCYITAAQQSSSRGYLMYNCRINSPEPGVETASAYKTKPGYFGRPWQATTSEVVFFNTRIEACEFPGYTGASLIDPAGWNSSLGGESSKMYEYGTLELSGVDNNASRTSWSTQLTAPELNDGTEITTFNFTKGTDDWDPIPALVENDDDDVDATFAQAESAVDVYSAGNRIYVTNVTSNTSVTIYAANGAIVKAMQLNADTDFSYETGLYIVNVIDQKGQKAVKVSLR